MKILRRLKNALFLAGCLYGVCWSLPQGADITHGNVTIQNAGSTQTITQGSDRAIINWNGFNIDIGELVNIVQPSSISAILNRVVGQDPSVILGQLRANGQVFLVNPNGIVFGDSARVNVGSLVSSTLNITDDDFLRGNLNFEQAPDKTLASVINQGTIKIDDNGFLVLTGPMVANEGVILARVGQVALAGGTRSTVSFDPTGMIQVALPEGSSTNNGIVSLTKSATSDLLANLVTSSAAPAGRMVVRDGRTFLEVDSGTVVNTGEIRAEGVDGQQGGRIVLDSTGHTLLGSTSRVSAAGKGIDSSGGEVLLLSDGQLSTAKGSRVDVSATGRGNGGFIEHSSNYGRLQSQWILGSPGGKAGRVLIDPERILVTTGDGSGGPAVQPGIVQISEESIEQGILDYPSDDGDAGTMTLLTEDGIDFQALNGGELTIPYATNFTINLTTARNPGDTSDAVSFAQVGDQINMLGGDFTLNNDTGAAVRDLYVVSSDPDGGRVTRIQGKTPFDIVGASGFEAYNVNSPNATVLSNGGNIGVEGSPIQVSGNLNIPNGNDVYLQSLDDVALTANVTNLTAEGDSFTIGNPVTGGIVSANNASFDLTGSLFQGGKNGRLNAGSIYVTTDDDIGTSLSPIQLTSGDVTLLGDNVFAHRASPGGFTFLDIATRAGMGQARFTDFDNTIIVDDSGSLITAQDPSSLYDINYSAMGNRTVSVEGPIRGANPIDISTTGTMTASVDAAYDLSLSGSTVAVNIDETGDPVISLFAQSTTGGVTVTGPVAYLEAESAGSASISATPPPFYEGSNSVRVTAQGSVSINGMASYVNAETPGDVDISGQVGSINIVSFDRDSESVAAGARNVTIDTEGTDYVNMMASGNVTANFTNAGQTQLSILADGSVRLTSDGDFRVVAVEAGPLASLILDGSITAVGGEGPNGYVKADSIRLDAGGTIGLGFGWPLAVDPGSSIYVNARGEGGEEFPPEFPPEGPLLRVLAQQGPGDPPAADLVGDDADLPLFSIDPNSGPVYFNGQLVTPQPPPPVAPPTTPDTPTTPESPTTPTTPDIPTTPTTPTTPDVPTIPDIPTTPSTPTTPTTPTTPVVEVPVEIPQEVATTIQTVQDQLGQQQGQLVDDGGSGSAANDGLVEQSPTQQLVAKLLESAGGEGLSTEMLLTLEIDEMGEVKVVLAEGEKSPTDVRIDTAEDLRADDMMDLDPEEMGEVAVKLYYDPATDQLIMAVDLRADDIIDLDVTEFQEIPVNLSYVFLSDPKLLAEALRANDIIDLEVEDLGEIPIRLHIESGSTGVGSQESDTDAAKN